MKDFASTALELRILVLTLGEAHHAGWWNSQFLSHVGLSFLERIYPCSTFAAAVRSAGRAARAVHDANVGTGDVFHLFRLSRELERAVETALTEQAQALEAQYQPLLMDRTRLLEALEALGGDLPMDSPAVGPMRLSARGEKRVSAMAAAYWRAFRDGTQVFPYFEDSSETLKETLKVSKRPC